MSLGRIVVLFSGDGTNLANIIETLHKTKKIDIVAAISNKANVKGVEIAQNANIRVEIIEHTNFKSREEFDASLVRIIQNYRPDLTVLAGFMRILTPIFTTAINAINLHPSLLPLFKGANALENSFNSGMRRGGVSVHWVEQELDGGSVISQEEVEIKSKDSLEEFSERIHKLEYKLLPQTIIKVLYDINSQNKGDTHER